jgi:hypothetical protein
MLSASACQVIAGFAPGSFDTRMMDLPAKKVGGRPCPWAKGDIKRKKSNAEIYFIKFLRD